MKRSDLICENGVINDKKAGFFVHDFELYGTKCTEVRLEENAGKALKKSPGKYFTVYSDGTDCRFCLTELLKRLIPDGAALVTGLGNERVCSDSLGVKALRYIPATAHLSVHDDFQALKMRRVTVVETGVTGQTGIESASQIRFLAEGICADFVIAIDSLACSEPERLCRTIQLTDTGIAPGSGVGNDRKEISSSTLGRRVIAIGVPTVIDYDAGEIGKMMVSPRNIDKLIAEFAKNIGLAVSLALNPELNEAEIMSLII